MMSARRCRVDAGSLALWTQVGAAGTRLYDRERSLRNLAPTARVDVKVVLDTIRLPDVWVGPGAGSGRCSSPR